MPVVPTSEASASENRLLLAAPLGARSVAGRTGPVDPFGNDGATRTGSTSSISRFAGPVCPVAAE